MQLPTVIDECRNLRIALDGTFAGEHRLTWRRLWRDERLRVLDTRCLRERLTDSAWSCAAFNECRKRVHCRITDERCASVPGIERCIQ